MSIHHVPAGGEPGVGERQGQHALPIGSNAVSIQCCQSLHTFSVVHNYAAGIRIAQQIGDVVGRVANQRLRIDREPATRRPVQHVVMVRVAMQRDWRAGGRQ